MIQIRKSADRGYFDHGWLKARHTFSFSEYHDPKHMRFRMLRVINEDRVAGGAGFGQHPHRDMEIITYVISGTLEHRDSLGNRGRIRAGEIQRMTAGSGIEHAEVNPDPSVECHLLQIWLFPQEKNLTPSWQQVEWKSQPVNANGLRLLVSPDARNGSALIHQDALLWHGDLQKGQEIALNVSEGRGGWLQLVTGSLETPAGLITAGDGLAVEGAEKLRLVSKEPAEFIWFDLG